MAHPKDEYNGASTHFTCYSGYQKYGVTGPCSCLQIIDPTPATVIPDIMRKLKPHNMVTVEKDAPNCSGCFKNRYTTLAPNISQCYVTPNTCECQHLSGV